MIDITSEATQVVLPVDDAAASASAPFLTALSPPRPEVGAAPADDSMVDDMLSLAQCDNDLPASESEVAIWEPPCAGPSPPREAAPAPAPPSVGAASPSTLLGLRLTGAEKLLSRNISPALPSQFTKDEKHLYKELRTRFPRRSANKETGAATINWKGVEVCLISRKVPSIIFVSRCSAENVDRHGGRALVG